jgi:hypothetical protein
MYLSFGCGPVATEVVGRSEGGCNNSSSARLSRVGHPRPLDVQRGFGLLPKREAGVVGRRAERVGSPIPFAVARRKGTSKKGFVDVGFLQQAQDAWMSLAVKTQDFEDSRIRSEESDRQEPRQNKQQAKRAKRSDSGEERQPSDTANTQKRPAKKRERVQQQRLGGNGENRWWHRILFQNWSTRLWR